MKSFHLKIHLVLIIILATVSFFIGGCNENKTENLVRVGYFPNVTHAPALVGFGEKRFEKEFNKTGINIEEKIFIAGPALMEALIAGEIDIGYVGPIPAINGFVQGADISVISGVNNGGAVLVAGKNSGITSVRDLAGKRISVPQFGNTQDIMLRSILKQNNLVDSAKGGNVEVLQVAPADLFLLMSRGEINAALVPEPWGSQLVADAGAHIVVEGGQIGKKGQFPTTIIIVRNEFLKEHPDIVKKWVAIHKEIVQYINNEPVKTQRVVQKMIKESTGKELNNELVKSALDRCEVTTELEPELMEEFAALSYEAGYLQKKPDLKPLLENLHNQ